MGYINFMGLNIPVIKELTLTGTNPAWYISVNQLGLTAYECYREAAYCGYADLHYDPDRRVYLPNTPITSANAGSLDLHDGWRVRARGPLYAAPNLNIEWYVDTDETTARSGTLPVAFGHTGGFSSYRETTTRIFAWSYEYPAAAEEPYQRKSYCITTVSETISYRADGSISQIGYALNAGTPLEIPVARLNVTYAADTYIDEIPEPVPEEDPNDEGEPSDEDGGDGDHTPIYEPVPIPDRPSMGAANAGFLTMYKLGLSAINIFASDMFASDVWEAIKLFFSNPIDFLVGCMLLPFEPETGSSYYPKFGIKKFEHAYPAVSNQYKDIDCGSVSISKYWGSAFDYEPYTKIQVWLPYIGYRDLPVDEIMDMTIGVKYRVDCLTGDCVAFVSTGVVGESGPQIPRVIAQFYGNCGVRVPFGSVSFDSAVAASINLVGAAATMGLSSGAGSVMTGSEGGVATDEGFSSPSSAGLVNAAIGVVSGLKPNVQKGGAAGASTGYMSIQKPYLIRRIPRQNLPSNFMTLKGYPSNIGGKLADFTGLAIVDDIQLNNIPAMEDERREIMKWLTGGVII